MDRSKQVSRVRVVLALFAIFAALVWFQISAVLGIVCFSVCVAITLLVSSTSKHHDGDDPLALRRLSRIVIAPTAYAWLFVCLIAATV